MIFSNLVKLTKSLTKKSLCPVAICFNSLGVQPVFRYLVRIKNFEQFSKYFVIYHIHDSFYKQHFFSTQPQCCLTFS